MRRLLLLTAAGFLLLQPAAQATPNETAFRNTVAQTGLWSADAKWTAPVYRQCVPWRAPWSPCDSSHDRINVLTVNEDFSPKTPTLGTQNVPVPAGFKPATGTDHQAVVLNYTGSGPEYVELWKARQNTAGQWTTVWGGASSFAALGDRDGLKVWLNGQGTSASGIALVPGIILLSDLKAGVINHPVAFSVPHACVATKPPATRNPSDGLGGTDCIQYGTKLKLPASVDVDAITSDSRWCGGSTPRPAGFRCPLPPVARMILKAAQTSYLVATEQTYWGNPVTFSTESWDRPRTGNWAGVPDGNAFASYFGCDGLTDSGGANPHPVTVQEGWEQDCGPGLGAAWKGFPYQQLYEIP